MSRPVFTGDKLMPYIYTEVDSLENTPKVGNKQCVALVRHYTNAPATAQWRAGKKVIGEAGIIKGTAIATFVDGSYQSNSTGNHAALFVKQDADGIYIMDQWASDDRKPKVSMRYVKRRGTRPDGSFKDPSNNADAYSVIE